MELRAVTLSDEVDAGKTKTNDTTELIIKSNKHVIRLAMRSRTVDNTRYALAQELQEPAPFT